MPRTFRHELVRKALHFGALIFPLAYAAGVARSAIIVALALVTLVALGVEVARAAHAGTARRFTGTVGLLLRAHEARGWTGATWLAIAFVLAAAALPPEAAIVAMWSAGAGDGMASVVGRGVTVLRGESWAGRKTWAGSVACLLVSAAGAMLLTGLGIAASVVVGVLAAAAERPTRPLDDNLRIVLVVGGGILLWRLAFA